MKEKIGKVSAVRFTSGLVNHPACLSSEGELSAQMERVLKKIPGADGGAPDASMVLEINASHPVVEKIKSIYPSDSDKIEKYAKLLYCQACLLGGIAIESPKEFCELITNLMI